MGAHDANVVDNGDVDDNASANTTHINPAVCVRAPDGVYYSGEWADGAMFGACQTPLCQFRCQFPCTNEQPNGGGGSRRRFRAASVAASRRRKKPTPHTKTPALATAGTRPLAPRG